MNTTPPASTPPRASGPWQDWSTTQLVLFIFLLLAADYLIQVVVYVLVRDLFVPVLVGNFLGVILPCRFAARRAGGSFAHDFHLDRGGAAITTVAVILAAAALAPTSFLAELSARIHPIDPQWVSFYQDHLPSRWPQIALTALTVVVIAPLAEELLFRGLIYRVARRSWGPWPAALVSALTFGLVHSEPWFLFGLIGLGVLLAWIYELTGSLLATVITHGVHNGISLYLMITQPESIGEPLQPRAGDWLLLAGSVVVIAVTIAWMRRRRPREPEADAR